MTTPQMTTPQMTTPQMTTPQVATPKSKLEHPDDNNSGDNTQMQMTTLAHHGINGDSAGNYHLMNEESNRGIIIPPKKNQLMDEESNCRMFIPPEIISSETRTPSEERTSAGNYQLIDKESTRGRGFRAGIYKLIYADSDR
jgi:hypothetical protein